MPTLESCAQCSKRLDKPNTKYCSHKCYTDSKARSDIVTKPCANCGTEISGRALSFARNRDGSICDQVFCDRSCYDAHRTKIRKAREQACACCGKLFIPSGGSAKKYCSWECTAASRKAKPHHRINCGCLFSPVKQIKRRHGIEWISANAKDGRITCCRKCHLEWIRKNPVRKAKISVAFTGKLHPNWMGGRKWLNDASFRGSKWKEIAEAVRKRDGYQCKHCGMSQSEHRIRLDSDLEVHHIVPFHNFPNAKQANRKKNLLTLCKSCHRIAEAQVPEVQMTLALSEKRSGQRPGYRRGEGCHSAKLTMSDIPVIRGMEGNKTAKDVSEAYGVTVTTIYSIWRRKIWKHVA